MKEIRFKSYKRAVSPVVATVLLISLVVAASALVYFIVVPMLQGNSEVSMITTQWFDANTEDGEVVDTAYITIQNTGTATAIINNVTITISNGTTQTPISNAIVVGETLPYELEVAARAVLVVNFNAKEYIQYGENVFRVRISYDEDDFVLSPENHLRSHLQ